MKQDNPNARLSRRERQIMDVVMEGQPCSAKHIMEALSDAPSYSAVRTLLSRMVDKGVLKITQDGARYLYSATIDEERAKQSALARILKIFFKGSRTKAVTALLDMEGEKMTRRELDELQRTITRLKNQSRDGKE